MTPNGNGKRMKPKVSIGLPVFNGADFVSDAISSIRAQSFTDFELIICDNASTDETEKICRSHASEDDRIVYIRHSENFGASANFAHAFNASRGDYFKWHGHDDMLEPDYLKQLVKVLDEDEECVLAFPRSVMVDSENREIWCFLEYLACNSDKPEDRLAAWLAPWRDDFTNPVFGLIRRDVMATTELLAPYLASDRVFIANIALLGKCRMVPECLFRRRLHTAMSTEANKNKADLRAWFDRKRPVLVFKQWRLLREYVVLLRRVPMERRSRMRCYLVLARWVRSRGTRLVGELMLPLVLNGQLTPLGHFVTRILKPVIRLP